MKTIEGTYTFANIFTTNNEVHAIEDYALAQIQMICDQEASKKLPHPCHAGCSPGQSRSHRLNPDTWRQNHFKPCRH